MLVTCLSHTHLSDNCMLISVFSEAVVSVEEMEGQQPTSPEEKKVNGQKFDHLSNPNEVSHTKCDFINTNRIKDLGADKQELDLQMLVQQGAVELKLMFSFRSQNVVFNHKNLHLAPEPTV